MKEITALKMDEQACQEAKEMALNIVQIMIEARIGCHPERESPLLGIAYGAEGLQTEILLVMLAKQQRKIDDLEKQVKRLTKAQLRSS